MDLGKLGKDSGRGEALGKELIELSHRVHANPEVSYKEGYSFPCVGQDCRRGKD